MITLLSTFFIYLLQPTSFKVLQTWYKHKLVPFRYFEFKQYLCFAGSTRISFLGIPNKYSLLSRIWYRELRIQMVDRLVPFHNTFIRLVNNKRLVPFKSFERPNTALQSASYYKICMLSLHSYHSTFYVLHPTSNNVPWTCYKQKLVPFQYFEFKQCRCFCWQYRYFFPSTFPVTIPWLLSRSWYKELRFQITDRLDPSITQTSCSYYA